jgi:hypothetical protein
MLRVRIVAGVLATATVGFLTAGCDSVNTAPDSVAPSATASAQLGDGLPAGDAGAGAPGSALTVLNTLPVQPLNTTAKYRRDAFGTAWSDVDKNGCDTRNDVLDRDLRSVTVRTSDNCTVLTGELTDPYTNRIIRFNRGKDSSAVQIDHVVALADAWRTGAFAWPADKRLQFANDPQNLLAVDGPTNIRKSDQDAGEWLPPAAGYQCRYVARQVGLKARYQLWVVQAEADAMRRVLVGCASQPVLGG